MEAEAMQGRRLFSLTALMILLALCFLSVPGYAGDHPWDIDNGDDNRDIRGVDLPDGAEGQTDKGIEYVEGTSAPGTSLSVVSPAAQFFVDYVFRSWARHGDLSWKHVPQVQQTEMKRSKRSIR
jgi:hypothetical protein